MDVSDVKKISECVEIAIMDAYDEEGKRKAGASV